MISFNKLKNRLNIQESAFLYLNDDSGAKAEKSKQQTIENPSMINNFYSSIKNNAPQTFKLNDGTSIQITPVEAKQVVYAYEELNDVHQGIFENFLQNNIQTYSMIIEFCEEYK